MCKVKKNSSSFTKDRPEPNNSKIYNIYLTALMQLLLFVVYLVPQLAGKVYNLKVLFPWITLSVIILALGRK
jgi:hypothetical protein